jgi:LETM1 and EF-hand domain-containing protein 1
MLAKVGTDGEEEARRAYRAAREESDQAAEAAVGEKVSSALIDRVRSSFLHLNLHKLIYSS